MASSIKPSVGLVWFSTVDPTAGAGVGAPLNQFLIRTDIPALYWKSGAANTAWTLIAGGGAIGGTIEIRDEAVFVANADLLNFAGKGVQAVNAGGGDVDITIPGNVAYLPEVWGTLSIIPSFNAALDTAVSTLFPDTMMTRSGSLVGLAARLSATSTAGNITFTVTKNGVDTALAIAAVGAFQNGSITFSVGVITYVAGDLIGVKLTTTAGFLPNGTLDAEATVQIFEVAS